jgi:hypothetical protein
MNEISIHTTVSTQIINSRQGFSDQLYNLLSFDLENCANPNSMVKEIIGPTYLFIYYYAKTCRMNKGGLHKSYIKVVQQLKELSIELGLQTSLKHS